MSNEEQFVSSLGFPSSDGVPCDPVAATPPWRPPFLRGDVALAVNGTTQNDQPQSRRSHYHQSVRREVTRVNASSFQATGLLSESEQQAAPTDTPSGTDHEHLLGRVSASQTATGALQSEMAFLPKASRNVSDDTLAEVDLGRVYSHARPIQPRI